MHAFQNETSKIVAVLDEAYKQINEINAPEILHLKNKVLMTIQRESGALKMQLGIDITNTPKPKVQPIKKLFGKVIADVKQPARDVNKPVNDTPKEVALKELRMKVDELWSRFLVTPSDHLLDSLSDLEIRGVAKRAGLPVTEEEPKRLTAEFIDVIKAAIQKQVALPEPDAGEDTKTNTEPIKTQEEIELEAFKEAIDKLYPVFNTIENKAILDTYSDLEIRGVAKRAGLPVTEEEPKKLDNKFLDHVKAAIKKKAELEKLGK